MRERLAGFLVLVALAWVFVQCTGDTAPSVEEPTAAASLAMPDVAGQTLTAATNALYGAYDDAHWGWPTIEKADLSPLGRRPGDTDNWVVLSSDPGAGQRLTDQGVPITLYALKASEAAWFEANPNMPSLAADVPAHSHTGEFSGPDSSPGALYPVWELVTIEYDTAHVPVDALTRPARESDLVVASVPAAGQLLRLGQILTITVRPEARSTDAEAGQDSGDGAASEGGADVGVGGDLDWDFDVPDRLCPTRWC